MTCDLCHRDSDLLLCSCCLEMLIRVGGCVERMAAIPAKEPEITEDEWQELQAEQQLKKLNQELFLSRLWTVRDANEIEL